jgi:hypothetical protein
MGNRFNPTIKIHQRGAEALKARCGNIMTDLACDRNLELRQERRSREH